MSPRPNQGEGNILSLVRFPLASAMVLALSSALAFASHFLVCIPCKPVVVFLPNFIDI